MKTHIKILVLFFIASCGGSNLTKEKNLTSRYAEPHRPQIHFSPAEKWMNDPNGMVYYNNIYHLFYQYYPDSTIWGPMHWGHATSSDLVHWQHQPIALFPDSLGYIFSGSAVVDINNTSGFGKDGKPALVAIFTHHDTTGKNTGRIDFQNQSIAYSTDEGKTWTKYANNPVVKNPGIPDFRDPKVMWYEKENKWIMTLATKDRITFYSSPDLKKWSKESEFGQKIGAHGGVWECPDLFPFEVEGKTVWVLLVSLNPGGPNGGSATQYFTGEFDGKTFIPNDTLTRWLDYGPDDYAGVTWSNTGKRTLFIGWMSNWKYANVTPTEKWRGAATIARELNVKKVGDQYLVSSQPVEELRSIEDKPVVLNDIDATDFSFTKESISVNGPFRLAFSAQEIQPFSITLSNEADEKLVVGYDQSANSYFIDRSLSGKIDFNKEFAGRHFAPRIAAGEQFDIILIFDNSSIEMFADNGLTVMTELFFPSQPFTGMAITSGNKFKIDTLQYSSLQSIW